MDFIVIQQDTGWIETYTGKKFYLVNPELKTIDILDIAHSLSMQCRFNGHSKFYYSVAQHSVLLTRWAIANGLQHLALTFLLHDASEAYLCDIPRPFKHMLTNYKELEISLEKVIAHKFGTIFPFPKVLKIADTRILTDERRALMRPIEHNIWTLPDGCKEPLGVTIDSWDPLIAKSEFLNLYWQILNNANSLSYSSELEEQL